MMLPGGEWKFFWAAASADTLPPVKGLEVAFAGRSNVGKSSLLNALTGRKSLARTSRTPGRTQELIFFENSGPLRLVDMPGYGYAEAPKAKVAAWTGLIHTYLKTRTNLARVYVLIDARHGIKASDQPALDLLSAAAVSHQIVLTKIDQVGKAELAERIEATRRILAKRPAAYPDLLATSSRSQQGIEDLRAAIVQLLQERAH